MSRTCSTVKVGFGSGSLAPLNKKTLSSFWTWTGISVTSVGYVFSVCWAEADAAVALGISGPEAFGDAVASLGDFTQSGSSSLFAVGLSLFSSRFAALADDDLDLLLSRS